MFPPIIHIGKNVAADLSISSASSGKVHSIPKDTTIYINSCGLHQDPESWGNDTQTERAKESFRKIPLGTFLAWSAGPRVCPGNKMSQVEFVAVFMTIFKRFRVEIIQKDGETAAQARQRAIECMEDSQSRLTLQMNRPRDVVLKFVER